MKKLIILPLLSAFFVSCADKKKDDEAAEPIEQPPAAVTPTPAPAPVVDANPTAAFRIPKADTNLPTAEQLKEGAESSIGTGSQKVTTDSTQPSTAVKPPSPSIPTAPPSPEDDLAPAE